MDGNILPFIKFKNLLIMTRSILRFKSLKTSLLWSLLLGIIFASCKKDSTPAPDNNAELQAKAATEKSSYDATVVPHLIGFWKFNGNPNDASGRGNNGTVKRGHAYFGAGIPVLTSDRFGRANMCYHFDKGGNIEVPYTKNLNPKQMTISLWSKKQLLGRTLNTDSYYLVAMNRWNGYKLQYQSQNKIFYTVKAVVGSDTVYYDRDDETAILNNEVWYHVAVTFKPGEMDFYINGDLVKSWTNTPGTALSIAANPINFVIGQDLPTNKYVTVDDGTGRFFVNYGGFFTGDMDDVMFFNAPLTAHQVKLIYNNQKTL